MSKVFIGTIYFGTGKILAGSDGKYSPPDATRCNTFIHCENLKPKEIKEDNSNSDQRDGQSAAKISTRTHIENQGDDKRIKDRAADSPLAKDPKVKRNELADASDTPSQKKVPSALPGAEMEGDAGIAARGAAAGTKGASSSSEGRKGDRANYGADQFGPGMATGSTLLDPTVKK